MKKLIMAAVIAVAAIGANAATVNWQATKGNLYDGAATPATITSGSAYLMYVTAAYTQADLVADFYAAKGNATATLTAMGESGALATGAGTIGSNARIAGAESTYATTADGTAYFVVFNDDKMYVSITTDALYDSMSGEVDATFASISNSSKISLDANAPYSSAGWYSVPEPTSGMLLLVGCALMVLKRKRA